MTDTETLGTVADRLAIRDLVDAYAHCADRRDPVGQAAVFTVQGEVRLFQADPSAAEPVQVVTGREALVATFTDLMTRYDATSYVNGQSSVTLAGDVASGETYCMAHHLLHEEGERVLLTMAIRYLDRFERTSAGWRIARRDLVFDWTDRRPSRP